MKYNKDRCALIYSIVGVIREHGTSRRLGPSHDSLVTQSVGSWIEWSVSKRSGGRTWPQESVVLPPYRTEFAHPARFRLFHQNICWESFLKLSPSKYNQSNLVAMSCKKSDFPKVWDQVTVWSVGRTIIGLYIPPASFQLLCLPISRLRWLLLCMILSWPVTTSTCFTKLLLNLRKFHIPRKVSIQSFIPEGLALGCRDWFPCRAYSSCKYRRIVIPDSKLSFLAGRSFSRAQAIFESLLRYPPFDCWWKETKKCFLHV